MVDNKLARQKKREEKEERMNEFDKKVIEATGGYLKSKDIDIIQVNVGLYCNQACSHCHLNSSPSKREMMAKETMRLIVEAARKINPSLIDITGGAPELNPNLEEFIESLKSANLQVQIRTNLTALMEVKNGALIEFFREREVSLVASLPCYLEENVNAQRGKGVYEKSIAALKKLNDAGYGIPGGLDLTLVYNPGGAFLPPPQKVLEEAYRIELKKAHGIEFTKLITITNMPLGRFLTRLEETGEVEKYVNTLKSSFNPQTIESLMCRHLISIGYDGRIYDCDFNLALGISVNHGAPSHILQLDPEKLKNRRIVTGPHCFGCTAGSGSSCSGALT